MTPGLIPSELSDAATDLPISGLFSLTIVLRLPIANPVIQPPISEANAADVYVRVAAARMLFNFRHLLH